MKLQDRVMLWMRDAFTTAIIRNKQERAYRVLEEALELAQSLDINVEQARGLVEYVYGREVGDPQQEVGGVITTVAALCAAAGCDMDELAEKELYRATINIEAVKHKQAEKPHPENWDR